VDSTPSYSPGPPGPGSHPPWSPVGLRAQTPPGRRRPAGTMTLIHRRGGPLKCAPGAARADAGLALRGCDASRSRDTGLRRERFHAADDLGAIAGRVVEEEQAIAERVGRRLLDRGARLAQRVHGRVEL